MAYPNYKYMEESSNKNTDEPKNEIKIIMKKN